MAAPWLDLVVSRCSRTDLSRLLLRPYPCTRRRVNTRPVLPNDLEAWLQLRYAHTHGCMPLERAYTRTLSRPRCRVSGFERRPHDRVARECEHGGSTGGRTFRGAIWARDHAIPSNSGHRPSPAQRASSHVVCSFRRRVRVEHGSLRVVSTRRPGTLSSAL